VAPLRRHPYERLKRAHRMLSDPRLAERTIGTIAYEAGFTISRISTVPSAAAMRKRHPMCVRAHDTLISREMC